MSQNVQPRQARSSQAKALRKPYVAPVLEDYGTVQELTLAGGPYYDISDSGQFYSSAA